MIKLSTLILEIKQLKGSVDLYTPVVAKLTEMYENNLGDAHFEVDIFKIWLSARTFASPNGETNRYTYYMLIQSSLKMQDEFDDECYTLLEVEDSRMTMEQIFEDIKRAFKQDYVEQKLRSIGYIHKIKNI